MSGTGQSGRWPRFPVEGVDMKWMQQLRSNEGDMTLRTELECIHPPLYEFHQGFMGTLVGPELLLFTLFQTASPRWPCVLCGVLLSQAVLFINFVQSQVLCVWPSL